LKILKSPLKDSAFPGAVVTVGTFDGIHQGHKKIIAKVLEQSETLGVYSTLVTFEPHPKLVVQQQGRSHIYLLTSLNEKIKLLESLGLDALFIAKFTKAFAETPAEDFVREILVRKLNVKSIIIGHDHAFGKDRQGNEQLLRRLGKELGFQVHTVEPIRYDGGIISSTSIRRLLMAGDIKTANNYLGREYSISGAVVKGRGQGRKLGYPTANIQPDAPEKLIPKVGIYATTAEINGKILKSVTYVGARPTFEEQEKVIEVHLHDFNDMIYGDDITVTFNKFLRDDKKFAGKDELANAIKQDKLNAITFFDNGGKG